MLTFPSMLRSSVGRGSRSAVLVLAVVTAACGGGGDGGIVGTRPPALTGIQIGPAELPLIVGATGQVQATLQGPGASTQQGSIAYSSASPSVATVNASSGQVTALTPGIAIITATGTHPATSSLTAATVSATSQVTVSTPPNALTDMTVAPSAVSVAIGQGASLVVVVTKFSAAVTSACAYSSNSVVTATVSPTGVVTGISTGSAVITVSCIGTGGGVTSNTLVRTVTVTVAEPPVASIELTVPNDYLQPGPGSGRTFTTIAAVVKNSLGAVVPRTVTWSSSIPAVATVSSSGLVTALSAGSTVITASVEGITRTATINAVRAFGAVHANQPTTVSYTSGVNSAGKSNTVVRTAVGLYTITFDDIGLSTIGRNFMFMVNADAGAPNASLSAIPAICHVQNGSSSTPVTLQVRCEDPVTGANKDAAFRAMLIGDFALSGAHAFTVHSAGQTAPYQLSAPFSFNSSGLNMVITPNFEPGSWNDFLTRHDQGITVPSQMSFAQVITNAAGRTCTTRGQLSASTNVDILCFDRTAFVVDATHQVLRLSAGRSGRVSGTALLAPDDGSSFGQGFASSGLVVTARNGIGKYTVTFPGLSATAGSFGVVATSWGSNDYIHCVHHVVSNSPISIDIACVSKTGAFTQAASAIQLLVLQ